jgi:hypothetical protein
MFRSIYEIFGLNPFFSQNMASFLGGIEDLCNEPYSGVSLYMFFGIVMLASTVFIYALQYHIIDKVGVSSHKAWWAFAGTAFSVNFGFVSIRMWTLLSNAPLKFGCDEEYIKVILNIPDIAMFAFVNGIFSFIVFTLLSWPPFFRRVSKNCYNTTPIPR